MSVAERRVVVTGMGVVCPLGNTWEALSEALHAGRSGVGPLTMVPPDSFPMSFGAEATEFSGKIDDFGPLEKDQKKAIRKGLKVMSRECRMGVAAAQRALADAELAPGSYDPERTGVTFGTDYVLTAADEFTDGILQCVGEDGRFDFSKWPVDGMAKMSPLWLLKYLPNMPASHIAIYNDLRGPNNSLTLREAVANVAVGEAYQTILGGRADAMLAGATGTRLHPLKMIHVVQHEELAADGCEPTTASRPFDRDRTGMVLGEGAGAIVLEELDRATARGATIYAEVLGASSSAAVGPGLEAQRRQAMTTVLRCLLRATGLEADRVGHVQAHGLGTRLGDVEEAGAINQVLGQRSHAVPVTAAKSYFGNLGAGSGMVEIISGILSFRQGRLFPVLNYRTPDPQCPLAVVRPGPCEPGDCFVNLSVTPQGQASAAAMRRFA